MPEADPLLHTSSGRLPLQGSLNLRTVKLSRGKSLDSSCSFSVGSPSGMKVHGGMKMDKRVRGGQQPALGSCCIKVSGSNQSLRVSFPGSSGANSSSFHDLSAFRANSCSINDLDCLLVPTYSISPDGLLSMLSDLSTLPSSPNTCNAPTAASIGSPSSSCIFPSPSRSSLKSTLSTRDMAVTGQLSKGYSFSTAASLPFRGESSLSLLAYAEEAVLLQQVYGNSLGSSRAGSMRTSKTSIFSDKPSSPGRLRQQPA